MTLQELTDFAEMKERLRKDESILMSLREAAFPGAQNLSGMPHGSGVHDKIGDLAAEIADMEDSIEALECQIAKKEGEVGRFIQKIRDDQTRIVFRLRFLRGLTWKEVAMVVGGRNTEDSVKGICYRYLATT